MQIVKQGLKVFQSMIRIHTRKKINNLSQSCFETVKDGRRQSSTTLSKTEVL